jgi:hypothetical protein
MSNVTFKHEFYNGDVLEGERHGLSVEDVWYATCLEDNDAREGTVEFAGEKAVQEFEDAISAGLSAELTLNATEEIRFILQAAGQPTVMRHVVTREV